jgi:hypothetical protein
MLQAFVDCVSRRAASPVDTDDARATLAVALAARQSMQRGAPVVVEELSRSEASGSAAADRQPKTSRT